MASIKEQIQGMQDFKAEYEAFRQEQQQKLDIERQQQAQEKGQDRGFEI